MARKSTNIKNFDEIGERMRYAIMDKVEDFEREVAPRDELLKIYKYASTPMAEDIEIFMRQHNLTGTTWKSFSDGNFVDENVGWLRYKLGFNIKKGGLAALFLEHGDNGSPMRMPNKAYYFIHYAVQNNAQYFEDVVNEEYNKYLRAFFESKKSEGK